jgi:hypothetical protein
MLNKESTVPGSDTTKLNNSKQLVNKKLSGINYHVISFCKQEFKPIITPLFLHPLGEGSKTQSILCLTLN